ncbi:hypothetical protein PM082_003547 [Marasmius tenuissimus]|nr:hypothetical protein PM082_003547 [Marasmius tenuissimus]
MAQPSYSVPPATWTFDDYAHLKKGNHPPENSMPTAYGLVPHIRRWWELPRTTKQDLDVIAPPTYQPPDDQELPIILSLVPPNLKLEALSGLGGIRSTVFCIIASSSSILDESTLETGNSVSASRHWSNRGGDFPHAPSRKSLERRWTHF